MRKYNDESNEEHYRFIVEVYFRNLDFQLLVVSRSSLAVKCRVKYRMRKLLNGKSGSLGFSRSLIANMAIILAILWCYNASFDPIAWLEIILEVMTMYLTKTGGFEQRRTKSAMREAKKIELIYLGISSFRICRRNTNRLIARLGMHKKIHAASFAICPTLLVN